MPGLHSIVRFAVLVLLFIQTVGYGYASDLRRIEDVPGIETYRMKAQFRAGETPSLQQTEAEGVFGKTPERHGLQITLRKAGRDPVVMEIRLVGGQLYQRMTGKWGKIEKYNLDELILLTPDQLFGIVDSLESLGDEVLNGRKVFHLRGDKDDLPVVGGGSDTIDFSRMDRADLDLWIDREERFVVKIQIQAQVQERGQLLPIVMVLEYSEFNEVVAVEQPPLEEIVKEPQPPAVTQANVTQKLGFEFPVPEGAHISIYGATVNLLTSMPLTEARNYTERAMRAAGYTPKKEIERAPGEFYADYDREGANLGVLVFQVTPKGATIQLGAIK